MLPNAEEHYRRAVQLEPTKGGPNNNLGAFLCRMGRGAEAEPYFRKAVADPFYSTPDVALTNAGVCQLKSNDAQAAERDFRDALQRNPEQWRGAFPACQYALPEQGCVSGTGLSAALRRAEAAIARRLPAWLSDRVPPGQHGRGPILSPAAAQPVPGFGPGPQPRPNSQPMTSQQPHPPGHDPSETDLFNATSNHAAVSEWTLETAAARVSAADCVPPAKLAAWTWKAARHALRLPARVLRQLESDQHDGIDYQVYLGSYISKYGRYLGMDEALDPVPRLRACAARTSRSWWPPAAFPIRATCSSAMPRPPPMWC